MVAFQIYKIFARGRMKKALPTILLIGCEGKTEKLYYDIVARLYNMSNRVKTFEEVGELKGVIDFCCEKKKEIAKKLDIEESEIEAWAVCDDDGRKTKYNELLKYAQEHNVKLAYSRPQFEYYLIQHFEQSNEHRRSEIFKILRKNIPNYNKGTIGNFEEIATLKPIVIGVAISNSKIRSKKTDKVFITAHALTSRIIELGGA